MRGIAQASNFTAYMLKELNDMTDRDYERLRKGLRIVSIALIVVGLLNIAIGGWHAVKGGLEIVFGIFNYLNMRKRD